MVKILTLLQINRKETYTDISYLMTGKPLEHVNYCNKPSRLVL